jgi:hypothetical protein
MKPLLLAGACVDIAVKHSKEASLVYEQIIDAWDRPDCQELLRDKVSLPIAEFAAWEKAAIGNSEYTPQADILTGLFDEYSKSDDFKYLFGLIGEFIRVGFNRKTDLAKGQCLVLVSNAVWLCLAVGFWTAGSYLEKHPNWDGETKVRLGDRVLDASALAGVSSERLHRRRSRLLKRYGYRLSGDDKLRNIAWYWYQSRVVYSGPDEFCRKYLIEEGIGLDPANVSREIRLCDVATGYPRKNLTEESPS